MSNQLICSSLLMATILVMSTTEAFPVVPWGSSTTAMTISRQPRTYFASAPVVFMSETAEEAATASDAAPAAEFEMTPEEAAAKRKIQRERNTLFVGNLPFGKLDIVLAGINPLNDFVSAVAVVYFVIGVTASDMNHI